MEAAVIDLTCTESDADVALWPVERTVSSTLRWRFGAENDGHENDEPIAGHEIARHDKNL